MSLNVSMKYTDLYCTLELLELAEGTDSEPVGMMSQSSGHTGRNEHDRKITVDVLDSTTQSTLSIIIIVGLSVLFSLQLTCEGKGLASASLEMSNRSSFQLPMSVLCE